MKKIIKTTFITVALLTLFSFTTILESNYVGTYGVSDNDPSNIELKLLS